MDQPETTLRRGVSILFVLGSSEAVDAGGLGVTRIAELLEREKSQVSRTLKTLVACGVLERDPTTLLYRLSWRLFALAARAGDHRLLESAPPLLERLVGAFDETAYLSVLQGREVLTVQTHSSSLVMQAAGWVGRTAPAYCTSSGRALLVDHSEERLRALFEGVAFTRFGPNTPTGVEDLAGRIAQARRLGYARVDEENEPGLVGVAAPIRDSRGRIVAAVNISGPKFRLGDRLAAASDQVVATAGELSRALGAPDLPPGGLPAA